MYREHWGLKKKPFENTPDPDFFYHSSRHEEAIVRLLYAIRENKGAALLTGEYGCGKTLLSRSLLAEIKDSGVQAALIFNPRLTVTEFLKEIVYQLKGDDATNSKRRLLQSLSTLLENNDAEGRKTIVVIDEAQAIKSIEIFEELRLLMNYQFTDRFLFTLILFGQPELREKIRKLPQFQQRIAVRYHLNGLDEEECREYIRHRLQVAGMEPEKARWLFSEGGCRRIYEGSKGIPRLINHICDMCLLVGFGRRLTTIEEDLVREVIKEFTGGIRETT